MNIFSSRNASCCVTLYFIIIFRLNTTTIKVTFIFNAWNEFIHFNTMTVCYMFGLESHHQADTLTIFFVDSSQHLIQVLSIIKIYWITSFNPGEPKMCDYVLSLEVPFLHPFTAVRKVYLQKVIRIRGLFQHLHCEKLCMPCLSNHSLFLHQCLSYSCQSEVFFQWLTMVGVYEVLDNTTGCIPWRL